jgi:hypothetical protein
MPRFRSTSGPIRQRLLTLGYRRGDGQPHVRNAAPLRAHRARVDAWLQLARLIRSITWCT